MKKAIKCLLAAGMLAGMVGCHTCDVCDDCGDAPATRRPKVGKRGCGGGGCAGGCATGAVAAPTPAPVMHQVPAAK